MNVLVFHHEVSMIIQILFSNVYLVNLLALFIKPHDSIMDKIITVKTVHLANVNS